MSTEYIPLDLLEEITVQPGAVVSKTLVKKTAGTVTLFAFDGGQGLSEHTAPYDALVQVLAGSAQVVIGGREVSVGSGEMIMMPAGVPHSLHAAEPFKMMLIMIKSDS
jgi:quercetin dioxygenase-like cupin family protein